ncbi:hypothetical protein GF406_01295 [candidate division KSB1 bacterium]|nr:hypothetical protein [candidate division KSB1 bacterium]
MSILNHQHHEQSSTNIKIAFFLNLGFTLVEIIHTTLEIEREKHLCPDEKHETC